MAFCPSRVKANLIFDIGGRHLAPTTGPEADRVIRVGQNLGEAALTGRLNEELGNPERIPARYAYSVE